MKKKNLLAVILVAALMTATLSACGSSSSGSTSSSSNGSATSSSSGSSSRMNETITAASGDVVPSVDELMTKIPDGTTLKIGYLAQNETDQFNVYMGQALEKEAAKYNKKVEVALQDAQSQAANQVSEAENMIAQDVDAVIINAVDQDASAPALTALKNAGIPVISLNTVLSNNDKADAYIGVDDRQAGEEALKIMAEALNGKGKINIVQGLLGHPANENRMTGIQTALKDYPDITINATQAADWDRAKAMNVTEDWLSGGGDFDGIIALNDEMAISVSNALTSAGKTGVKVVGIDAIDEALELVKSGGMSGTVFQDAILQGRGALDLAVAISLKVDVKKEYIIPFQQVTSKNVEEFFGAYDM